MPSSDEVFHKWKVAAICHISSTFRKQRSSGEDSAEGTQLNPVKRYRRVDNFSLVDIEKDIVRICVVSILSTTN